MQRPLISFDWAIKRLLRQKANFAILEGFLSVLLKEGIFIKSIPESESNKENEYAKINKVDLLCETQKKELILIELQYNSENDYFHRMLFGTSKLVTDYMTVGNNYDQVKKIISINIVYFDLGQGEDYLYHGKSEFVGMNFGDTLLLSQNQQKLYTKQAPSDLYPEFYIIKVNKFNDIAKNTLDEWIYYFKKNKLPDKYSAKGLDKVSQILKYDAMDSKAKQLYDAHQKELMITYGVIETAKFEGHQEGMEKGMKIITENTVCRSYEKNLSIEFIADLTNLSIEKVKEILKAKGLL